ncbi:MAG: hypothetical protein NXI31_05330 [bacterium]|nr:hypothetical protein [bacterium]
MGFASSDLRLVRLETLQRLRRFGWWPWLVLLGWSLLAAGQEPRLLRGFGIELIGQGVWAAGALVLLALVATGSGDTGSRSTVTPNPSLRQTVVIDGAAALVCTVLTGSLQALFSGLADWSIGRAIGYSASLDVVAMGVAAVGFTLVMLPASLAVALLVAAATRSWLARFAIAVAVCFSWSWSTLWWQQPGLGLVTASILAAAGVVVLALRSPATSTGRQR